MSEFDTKKSIQVIRSVTSFHEEPTPANVMKSVSDEKKNKEESPRIKRSGLSAEEYVQKLYSDIDRVRVPRLPFIEKNETRKACGLSRAIENSSILELILSFLFVARDPISKKKRSSLQTLIRSSSSSVDQKNTLSEKEKNPLQILVQLSFHVNRAIGLSSLQQLFVNGDLFPILNHVWNRNHGMGRTYAAYDKVESMQAAKQGRYLHYSQIVITIPSFLFSFSVYV
jgi:hypothetical protein